MEALAVNRTLAGHGIGARLFRWAEERIAAEGKRLVRLDCMADNPRLNRYYEDQAYRYVRVKRWDDWGASLYEKEANPPG
ncbi:N-acetyltransferase [Cohnella sp. REN36]|uniref:GNAT family N-acetyltransferase n=1 Tax=Cohnella sp. REN36 TaxID=2887347 RepID=UPI001D15D599|nr:GNAT family N-acetyltransferase [Cohnella sp. REN36]MCC3371665.1 GNAT family N-acetyltransferase [Cohnella sp. REN36]